MGSGNSDLVWSAHIPQTTTTTTTYYTYFGNTKKLL